MPRTRRRRRRRNAANGAGQSGQPAVETLAAEVTPAGRRPPSAAVVLALCLGIWIGLAIATNDSGIAVTVALWVSVLGAGLAGGRLLRRWLQRRSER